MSEQLLRTLLVIDAAVIVIYAITVWLAEISPGALTIAVVAAMVTQVSLVVAPRRPTPAPTPAGLPPADAD